MDNLEKVKSILKIVNGDDTITKTEVGKVLAVFTGKISTFVSKTLSDTRTSIEKNVKSIVDSSIKSINSKIDTNEQQTLKLFSQFKQAIEDIKNVIPDIEPLDSNIQKIHTILKDIDLKASKEETAIETRDKLESLKDEERLDVSAIKGLEKFVQNNRVHDNGGTIAYTRGAVKMYDLSSQLNGSLKTFALPAFWKVISVHLSSFPNIVRETVDYTTDGSAFTITFTDEIAADSTLSTGQTCIVVYSEP